MEARGVEPRPSDFQSDARYAFANNRLRYTSKLYLEHLMSSELWYHLISSPWPSDIDFGVLKGYQVFVTHKSSPDTFPNEDMHVGRGGIEPPSSDFQSAALTTSATTP